MFWIITYHHRYGTDAWPIYTDSEPCLEAVSETLEEWEPERGEYLSVHGPFEIPV